MVCQNRPDLGYLGTFADKSGAALFPS